jgi:hypothetical protein
MKVTILAGVLALGLPLSLQAADPIGYLGFVDDSAVNGWACDPDAFAQPLQIHLYATHVQTGTVAAPGFCVDIEGERACLLAITTASAPREPAVAQLCGGYANHGFSIPTPYPLKNGGAHKVYAFAINVGGGPNPRLPNATTPSYQFTFSGAHSGWDYGLERQCVKSGDPAGKNYFESTAGCESYQRWTVALQSERDFGQGSCSGPNSQSLPISASWGTGNFQFGWSSTGGDLTAHLKTDITNDAGPDYQDHPCGENVFNWFVLMDHLAFGGGPLPEADRMGVHFEASYDDWLQHPQSRSRYIGSCAAMWLSGAGQAPRMRAFEINFIESNWGDASPDPEVIWSVDTPEMQWVILSGPALGFQLTRNTMQRVNVNCGSIFRHLVERGILEAPVNGWASTTGAAVFLGHEFKNSVQTDAGAAYVAIKRIEIEAIDY